MSDAKKLKERIIPKALVCGMLKDGGRILFLISKDQNGTERLELPCFFAYSDADIMRLAEEFKEQTGIDGEVGEVEIKTRHNAGSRKRKKWIPCLVFKISARNRTTRASSKFSGFKWLVLDGAKKYRLSRNVEWILSMG